MQTENKASSTMTHRFWRHVARKPDQTGFIVQQKPRKRVLTAPPRGDPALRYGKKTWKQAGFIVAAIMVILKEEIGLVSGDRAAIISWNCPEWIWINMAIWTLGGITVGIDPRYAADRVCYIIKDADRCDELPQTRTRVVFVEDESQSAKLMDGKHELQDIKIVLIEELMKRVEDSELDSGEIDSGLRLLALTTAQASTDYLSKIEPKNTAMLLYTSGSTGDPKGVILFHENIAFMSMLISRRVKLNKQDLFLGQLPANHVFNWNGVGPCLWEGIPSFYCHPLEMKKHLKNLHPTILFGVPKVWLSIFNEVRKPQQLNLPFLPEAAQRAINSFLGRIKSAVLKRAQEPQKSHLNRLANRLVSMRLSSALGGRLRLLVSGGAALPDDLAKFFRVCNLEVLQGYGATETTGCISVETLAEKSAGSSGKLLDLVELDFESQEGQASNSGVILIAGPTVSRGYWNKPAQTAESFKDGKFRSGDRGHLDEGGFLFIGDREGDDGKLGNGEKVSSREIIELFRDSLLVEYIAPVFLNRACVTALVFLRESAAVRYLLAHGAASPAECSLAFLAKHELISKAVRSEIAAVNDRLGLSGEWKRIRKFEIVPSAPSTANGLLTVKMELSAKNVLAHYAGLVEGMYAGPN